ncbi:MAG: hypothetical protein VX640_03520 [Pseudomonadota bacterium]|nr:hypothetical protein [Pseudomonadota bacterium]
MPPAVKSALAILAGLAVIVVASTAADLAFSAAGLLPPLDRPQDFTGGHWLFALAYRCAVSIAGCWLAARLAPSRPLRHALILGGIGVAISAAGAVVMSGVGPAWYPWSLAVLALPCAWAGGALYARGNSAG